MPVCPRNQANSPPGIDQGEYKQYLGLLSAKATFADHCTGYVVTTFQVQLHKHYVRSIVTS